MSDDRDLDADEYAKTLNVISKFCRAAAALIHPPTMPAVHLAMIALLAKIDEELQRAGLPLQ